MYKCGSESSEELAGKGARDEGYRYLKIPVVMTNRSTWVSPVPRPCTCSRVPSWPQPACWDQVLYPVPTVPENTCVKCLLILKNCLPVRWCNASWQYWSPLITTAVGWCGTPHRSSSMNWVILWKTKSLKLFADCCAVVPIQKIYLLQLSYISTAHTRL